jgi:cellulose synthase/poly-beta-1,6-N-acetylglucosamine synthase-like glycosyltransferase
MAPIFLVTLIGCILFAVYGVLIDYYRRAWKAIPTFNAPAGSASPGESPFGRPPSVAEAFGGGTQKLAAGDAGPFRTKISVLVPARNEEANIAACVDSLFRQSYPRDLYEVIVIDDHSTDRTPDIVSELRYPELSLVCLRLAAIVQAQPILAHKKWAIETGIGCASGELIVTTDADCLFHPDWLTTMAAFYEQKNAKFIAAPVRIGDPAPTAVHPSHRASAKNFVGPALPRPSSFVPFALLGYIGRARARPLPRALQRRSLLSIFQTLDFLTLQGITGAAVSKKFHSMCNGANLAYAKSAFYEVGGFKGIDSLPSGDDMLLMHKIYCKYPDRVFFLKSPKAIVTTQPETTWKGFFHQRIRWASKADHYDDKRIFWVLLLVYIVNAMFSALAIAACWNSWWLWLLLVGLAVKTIVEYPFVFSVAVFFDQWSLMVYFPILQPLHILYTIVIGWLGKFGSYRWKDRKISK